MGFRCGVTLSSILIAAMLLGGSVAASPQNRRKLSAPTYYLAIKGDLEDNETIRVRGATNLPAGANIVIGVGKPFGDFGMKPYTDGGCAVVKDNGLFELELHPKSGKKFRRALMAVASFYTNGGCKQPASVLLVVGENGEYLGNDNYDNAADKSSEWTPGMTENPQLGQSSGWHLGLGAMDWVE
jgi:hypothetical protein